MPDLFAVIDKRWKFILGLTLLTAVIALIVCLVRPKEYLSTATSLPANSVIADKASVFNQNIEALYSSLGSPDELERMEGTANLDTIYIAVVKELDIISHYKLENSNGALYKAARQLKDKSRISRSAYGELKVKVWDRDPLTSAEIANSLMRTIQQIHQQLKNENNIAILAALQSDHQARLKQFKQVADSAGSLSGAEMEIWQARKTGMLEQLQQYEKMIAQYQFAVNANPLVLLTVENARPALKPDKPKIVLTILLSAFAAFMISFLVALFVDSRKSLQ